MSDEPQDLTDEQAAYYRQVLIAHGSVYGAGTCAICGVTRCPNWVDAYDRLAAAGRQMAEPQVFEPRGHDGTP